LNNRYLVATDLSDRSLLAFKRALYLAKKNAGVVDVFHAIEVDQQGKSAENARESAKNSIEKMISDSDARDIVDNVVIKSGEPHILINEFAGACKSKLIIIGAHKKNMLLDMFRGSTIERLLRDGRAPVLICNQRQSGDYGSALFCVVDDEASRIMINAAAALNVLQEAEVNVVHACEFDPPKGDSDSNGDEKVAEKHKSNMVAERALQIYRLISNSDIRSKDAKILVEGAVPINLIQRAASEFQADICVVGTKSTVGLERFFLGSVAKEVLRQVDCDILIVPSKIEGEEGGAWKT
jgi:universal stress protein E